MNILNIVEGIGLIILGIWISVIKFKYLTEGKQDTLGGNVGLLIVGIGLIICGVILIAQQL